MQFCTYFLLIYIMLKFFPYKTREKHLCVAKLNDSYPSLLITSFVEGFMRIWARIWKENHMLSDMVVENHEADTRTHKIFNALDEVCVKFDLSKPIWLDKNIADFKRNSKTRFSSDNFIDSIDFDYLEFMIIEEDL